MPDPTLLILFTIIIAGIAFWLGRVYERAQWEEQTRLLIRDLKLEEKL